MSSPTPRRKNVRTKDYKDRLEKVPERIRAIADELYKVFLANEFDPQLENHDLKDTKKGRHRQGSRSVSVTHRYRAIYVVDGNANVWYWIGSHEDYNNYTGLK